MYRVSVKEIWSEKKKQCKKGIGNRCVVQEIMIACFKSSFSTASDRSSFLEWFSYLLIFAYKKLSLSIVSHRHCMSYFVWSTTKTRFQSVHVFKRKLAMSPWKRSALLTCLFFNALNLLLLNVYRMLVLLTKYTNFAIGFALILIIQERRCLSQFSLCWMLFSDWHARNV